jgi:hypothetical protein
MEQDDIQEILKIFPTWDGSVQESLQKKDYESAEHNLGSVLENISMDDWSLVYWQGIFSGIPTVLGDTSEGEWKNMVRPIIVRSLIATASGKGLSIVIQELKPDEQLELVGLFTKNIPGITGEEKEGWLKEKRPSIFMLAIAAPAQELGINPIRYPDNLSVATLIRKFKILPRGLRDSLFSYGNAEIIFRAGKNNHLSDEKISLLSRVVGRVLMGFIHMEDFQKEVESGLSIDARVASALANELKDKIFYSVGSDISDVYEPVNLSLEKRTDSNKSEISISDFSSDAEESIPITTQGSGEPFIIQEEKSLVTPAEEKKSILKSISIPLGFFKPKSAVSPTNRPVKAEVETPNQAPKNQARVVHYSELRTSFSPFDGTDFLDQKKSEEIKPEIKTEEKVGILGTIKKSEPRMDGNTIDLRA